LGKGVEREGKNETLKSEMPKVVAVDFHPLLPAIAQGK